MGLSLKSEAQKDLKTLAAGRPSGATLMTTSNTPRERQRQRTAARCFGAVNYSALEGWWGLGSKILEPLICFLLS